MKTDTRYVLRTKDHEKVISVKDETEAEYWTKKAQENPDWTFTEVVVHQRKEECESCSA